MNSEHCDCYAGWRRCGPRKADQVRITQAVADAAVLSAGRSGEYRLATDTGHERGSVIVVYDELGQMLFSKATGSGPHDGLLGFTNSTVTVRTGLSITTYGEYGQTMYTRGA